MLLLFFLLFLLAEEKREDINYKCAPKGNLSKGMKDSCTRL